MIASLRVAGSNARNVLYLLLLYSNSSTPCMRNSRESVLQVLSSIFRKTFCVWIHFRKSAMEATITRDYFTKIGLLRISYSRHIRSSRSGKRFLLLLLDNQARSSSCPPCTRPARAPATDRKTPAKGHSGRFPAPSSSSLIRGSRLRKFYHQRIFWVGIHGCCRFCYKWFWDMSKEPKMG